MRCIGHKAHAHHAPRRGLWPEPWHRECRDQQRERQRHEPDTRLQCRQLEHDREEQRDREEDASLDEVLEEEHRQPADELSIPEHRRADERFLALSLKARLPGEQPLEDEQASQDQPRHRRHPEQLRTARLRRDPSPDARA